MKNKLIYVFFIFLFYLLLSSNVCFADIEITYNNTTYTIPDFPSPLDQYAHKMVVMRTDNLTYPQFFYYASDGEFIIQSVTDTFYNIKNGSDGTYGRLYKYYKRVSGRYQFSILETQQAGSVLGISRNSEYIGYCTETLSYNGDIIYQAPVVYEQYPYFLNDEQSLSIGGQSVIVEPRRF